MGLDFTGNNQGALSVSSITVPSIGSVSFWIRPDSITGTQRIIATDDDFEGRFDGNELICDWGVSGASLLSLGTMSIGTLYHCVCNYNTSSGNAEAFRNGVSIDTSTDRNGVTSGLLALAARPTNTDPFSGLLSDVRIYNRILTSNEVLTIYRSRGADTVYFGLLHRWQMKEGPQGTSASGTGIIKDSGPTKINLTPESSNQPTWSYEDGLHLRRKPI